MNPTKRRGAPLTRAAVAAALAALMIFPSSTALAETDEVEGPSVTHSQVMRGAAGMQPDRQFDIVGVPDIGNTKPNLDAGDELVGLSPTVAVTSCGFFTCEVEPNDSRATANQLGAGASVNGFIRSDTDATSDVDVFEFVISEPRRVEISLTFTGGYTGLTDDAHAFDFAIGRQGEATEWQEPLYYADRNGDWLRSVYFYFEPGTYYIRISGDNTMFTWDHVYTLHFKVPPRPFADVSPLPGPNFSQFDEAITWMSAAGISTGYPEGYQTIYKPFAPVARDAMAAFLYRFAGEPEYPVPVVSPFTDVPRWHPFYVEINWLAYAGISTGWVTGGGREFRPGAQITRDAMSAFLYRFFGEPTFVAPTTSPFADVAKNQSFYKEITWLADAGISTGWDVSGRKQFRPYSAITRDAMAAFLFRSWMIFSE